jgi:hypothetical protein
MKRIRLAVLSFGLMVAPIAGRAQTTYNVNFNGATVDLTGTIQVSAFGMFSALAFNANAVSYSITASNNGLTPFTFTNANSTWGGFGTGTNVSINATPTLLQLSSTEGDVNLNLNVFLIANVVANGAQENLRYFNGNLGFRRESLQNGVVYEQVSEPFVLGTATVVPEPGTYALLGTGLLLLAAIRRRRV